AIELPPGLVTHQAPVAMLRRSPSWHDHIGVYLTAEELGLPPGTMSSIIRELGQLPFERTMRALSWLHHAVIYAGTRKDRQLKLARQIFQGGELLRRAERFIRAEERPSVVFEQQLVALQRLAVLHCAPGALDAEVGSRGELAFISALVSTTGVIVDRALPVRPSDGHRMPSRDDLLRLFLAGTPFAHREWLGGALFRGYRMFAAIAESDEARKHPEWCDFDSWLHEAGIPDVRSLQLAGLGLANAAGVLEAEPTVNPISPAFLDSLGADGVAAVEALSADREWYRAAIAATQRKAADAARNAIPFYQRPYLRLEDGRLLPLGWRAATAVVTEEGLHYRLADLASDLRKRSQYNAFSGWLYEQYAVEVAEMAHGDRAKELFAAGRVYREHPYETGKGRGQTPDVALDYGLDLVLVEATHSRPTIKSLIDLDLKAIERDLEKTIGRKLRQLATAIQAIRDGRAILPDLEPTRIKRVWPVLLLPAPVFQNDVIWEYIDGLYPPGLRHPLVRPLTLLDTADYEWLMGQAAEGVSVIGILERKTQDLWARRDLRSWFNDAADPLGVGESEFIGRLFGETIETLAEPLKPREAE
ncbi:MAG: hypothetical protein ACRDQZ_18665, partial [Mycobacteriales bacterium]